MALPRIYINRGISLIEVIVAIGLIGLIGSVIGNTHMNEYFQYSFKDEHMTLVSSLQKARSQSMHNICLGNACSEGLPHGIHFKEKYYVIFQGESYDPNDPQNEKILFEKQTRVMGPSDIVFAQGSGNTSTSPFFTWDIVLDRGNGYRATTTVNEEGLISWTH